MSHVTSLIAQWHERAHSSETVQHTPLKAGQHQSMHTGANSADSSVAADLEAVSTPYTPAAASAEHHDMLQDNGVESHPQASITDPPPTVQHLHDCAHTVAPHLTHTPETACEGSVATAEHNDSTVGHSPLKPLPPLPVSLNDTASLHTIIAEQTTHITQLLSMKQEFLQLKAMVQQQKSVEVGASETDAVQQLHEQIAALKLEKQRLDDQRRAANTKCHSLAQEKAELQQQVYSLQTQLGTEQHSHAAAVMQHSEQVTTLQFQVTEAERRSMKLQQQLQLFEQAEALRKQRKKAKKAAVMQQQQSVTVEKLQRIQHLFKPKDTSVYPRTMKAAQKGKTVVASSDDSSLNGTASQFDLTTLSCTSPLSTLSSAGSLASTAVTPMHSLQPSSGLTPTATTTRTNSMELHTPLHMRAGSEELNSSTYFTPAPATLLSPQSIISPSSRDASCIVLSPYTPNARDSQPVSASQTPQRSRSASASATLRSPLTPGRSPRPALSIHVENSHLSPAPQSSTPHHQSRLSVSSVHSLELRSCDASPRHGRDSARATPREPLSARSYASSSASNYSNSSVYQRQIREQRAERRAAEAEAAAQPRRKGAGAVGEWSRTSSVERWNPSDKYLQRCAVIEEQSEQQQQKHKMHAMKWHILNGEPQSLAAIQQRVRSWSQQAASVNSSVSAPVSPTYSTLSQQQLRQHERRQQQQAAVKTAPVDASSVTVVAEQFEQSVEEEQESY